jgi:DNA polymerase
MSESTEDAPGEPAHYLRLHLDSLRAAGVEWLPSATQQHNANAVFGVSNVDQTATLFEDRLAQAPQEVVGSAEDRRQALAVLTQQVASCTRCSELARLRTQTVFGVGPIDPELCFVGEAPGADEDARGEPFVGPAGQLLNRIIAACGMQRQEVYICNIIKCRPPGNRLPLADEAAHCRDYLERQLELIRPRYLCALGACAAQNLLQSTLPIGRLRGRFHDYRGIPVLCTYHPAYLLRSPEKKKDVWDDMKRLLARMGRQVPEK